MLLNANNEIQKKLIVLKNCFIFIFLCISQEKKSYMISDTIIQYDMDSYDITQITTIKFQRS